jgi:hypothetical protein
MEDVGLFGVGTTMLLVALAAPSVCYVRPLFVTCSLCLLRAPSHWYVLTTIVASALLLFRSPSYCYVPLLTCPSYCCMLPPIVTCVCPFRCRLGCGRRRSAKEPLGCAVILTRACVQGGFTRTTKAGDWCTSTMQRGPLTLAIRLLT